MAKRQHWLPEEVAVLDQLVGSYPSNKVISLFRTKAKKVLGDKYVDRTKWAIRNKALKIAGSIRPTKANFTVAEFALIIGRQYGTVRQWKERGLLKCGRNGYHSVLTQTNLDKFAEQYPHLLSGCDEVGLLEVYSEEQVKRIKEHKPASVNPVPVVSPDGIVYSSIKEASLATGICTGTIHYHLNTKTKKWMTLDEYNQYKNTWHGIKTYPIYKLNKKTLKVSKHVTTTKPNTRLLSVVIVDGSKTYRKQLDSSQWMIRYDLEDIKTEIRRITKQKIIKERDKLIKIMRTSIGDAERLANDDSSIY